MFKRANFHVLIFLMIFGSACTVLQRSKESGYGSSAAATTESTINRIQINFDKSANASNQNSDKVKLKKLENSLTSEKELEQYSKALPYFNSEKEKIDFLSLEDYEAKQSWLNNNKFFKRSLKAKNSFQNIIASQDIAIGMPISLVKKSWGDPQSVEISGNEKLRNERWKYLKYVSTPDGFKLEKKIVYFEGGRVVGWEQE